MQPINDFSTKALKQIKWWAWAASVGPITGLAGIFFIWVFGFDDLFHMAMIIGATTMFAVAVTWWWWTIWTIAKLLKSQQSSTEIFKETLKSIKDVRNLISVASQEHKNFKEDK